MQPAPYPPSWYADTAHTAPDRPALAGTMRADVAVLGGGLGGLSTALELAERGYSVRLLEAARLGWGASGRNGGQVLAGFSADLAGLAARHGLDTARRLLDMSREAVALVRERVRRHAIACDLASGHLTPALKPRQERALAEDQALMARLGHEAPEIWSRDQVAGTIVSPRYLSGLYDPEAAHLHPLNYALGLARAAEQAGAVLHEGSPVTAIEPGALVTRGGRVEAEHIVIAGDAYLGGLLPRASRRLMPVASCIVATEPLGPDRALTRNIAVADANIVLDYFRLAPDGRLLFGGLADYSGRQPRDIAARLRPRLERVFPHLAGVGISHAWGGLIGLTMRRMPMIGRLGPGLYVAQGYSGHGVALSTFAGRVIAETVAGASERIGLLESLPQAAFPGGGLRMPALVLAMAWYRLKDLL